MNGKQIELENATINCITENVEENCFEIFDEKSHCYSQNISYELEATIGNITKKRFIKLLMAREMQRNEALEISKYIYRKYGFYNPMHLMLF